MCRRRMCVRERKRAAERLPLLENFCSLASCRGARDADAVRVQNNQLKHEENRKLNEVLCVFIPKSVVNQLFVSSFFT